MWSKLRDLLHAYWVLRVLLVASGSMAASGCFISFPDYPEGNTSGTGGRKTMVDGGSGGGHRTTGDAASGGTSAAGASAGGATAIADASVVATGSGGASSGGTTSGGTAGAGGAHRRKP